MLIRTAHEGVMIYVVVFLLLLTALLRQSLPKRHVVLALSVDEEREYDRRYRREAAKKRLLRMRIKHFIHKFKH
ncbi:MAG: hypothetical protein KBC16_01985 [Candidatus Pacebacteria bacterium]|nr:hypothetical protein [Candidatus Paceibacterota bacterium]